MRFKNRKKKLTITKLNVKSAMHVLKNYKRNEYSIEVRVMLDYYDFF